MSGGISIGTGLGLGPRTGGGVPAEPFSLEQLPAGSVMALWDARHMETSTISAGAVAAWKSLYSDHTAVPIGAAGARPSYSATGLDGVRPMLVFDGNSGGVDFGDMLVSSTGPFASRMWIFALIKRGGSSERGSWQQP